MPAGTVMTGDLYMLLTDLEAASMGIGTLFFGANRVLRAGELMAVPC